MFSMGSVLISMGFPNSHDAFIGGVAQFGTSFSPLTSFVALGALFLDTIAITYAIIPSKTLSIFC
jgi:hypothetical protein